MKHQEGNATVQEANTTVADRAAAHTAAAARVGDGPAGAGGPGATSGVIATSASSGARSVSAAPQAAVAPFKFIPWFRAGAAVLIRGSAAANAQSAPHFRTQVDLAVDGSTVSVPVHLFGPADAAGIEAGQILRRTPAPDAPACEPHLFPAIEFRDADLPWRLTPVAPAADTDRLWPWLVLIALKQTPGLRVKPFGSAPLPMVVAPRNELPDLAESPLWAHVQISGPFPADVADSTDAAKLAAFVRSNPGRASARLLCPRRMAPNTRYLMCLVPAFETGRRAGLGEDFKEEELGLTPAWSTDGEATVTLPVYDHWSITTGAAEDPAAQFERLARALRPHHVPPEAAVQSFDLNFDPQQAPQHTVQLPLQGALRPAGLTVPATPQSVQAQLKAWVNRPADIEDAGGSPQLAPPLYAGRLAARRRAGVSGAPTWFSELNLDPQHRLAAAAGAQMVQRQQDALVAEAWRQAGEVAPANDLLRGAEAARSAGRSLKSRFLDRLQPKRLLQLTGAAHARIGAAGAAGGAGATLAQAVSASDAMPAAFESAYRRIARTRGPHQRRWLVASLDSKVPALFDQGFDHFPTGPWIAVHQTPTPPPPSHGWFHEGNDIVQTGDIHHGEFDGNLLPKPGTMYITGLSQWRDVHWSFKVRPDDDDAVGFVFRYQNPTNFYRFSMDSQRKYRRLVKCVGGTFTLLWEDSVAFVVGRSYGLRVQAEGSRIRIFIDTVLKVDVTDASLATGRLGFYTWGISSARFTPVLLRPQLGFSMFGAAGAGTRRRDEGTLGGASVWNVLEDGKLVQTGTTHSTPTDRDSLAKKGGAIRLPDTGRSDYSLSFSVIMDTDGDCGLMFRMHPTQPSYYRFSVSVSGRYMRLVKCVNGVFTLLWQRDEGVQLGQVVDIFLIVDGSRISGVVGGTKRFDLRDVSLPTGEAALYMWKSKLRFHRVGMRALRHDSALTTIDTGKLDLPALAASASAALDPTQTVVARTLDRLAIPASSAAAPSALAALQIAPDYPQPLVSRLAQEAPHLLLPGLDGVPDSAIVMLEPNAAFIAAYLAGANEEIGRELLWRGFPANARATPFRQFWDVRGGLHAGATPQQREAHKDIAPIASWPVAKGLAQQVATRAAGVVFLVRSELVRRFPDARVQLVKAEPVGAGRAPGAVVAPYLFTGRLSDDVAYFGFEVPAAQASGADGGAGWYFAIEQQPGAVRFGLVLQRNEAPLDWTDVGWNHVGNAAYVHSAALTLQPHPPGPRWGRNGAHMAAITRRRPFQLLVHASRLI